MVGDKVKPPIGALGGRLDVRQGGRMTDGPNGKR